MHWRIPQRIPALTILCCLLSIHQVFAEVRIVHQRAESGSDTVLVEGLSSQVLDTFSGWNATDDRWSKVFALYVASDGTAVAVPVLGSYSVDQGKLSFRPRYALQPGIGYLAIFDPSAVISTPSDVVRANILIEPPPKSAPAKVVTIYPSATHLPENLLKLYIHFSTPMRTGDSYRYLRLLDEKGNKIERPFLELPQELWNDECTRLTLLFDPGRVKQGLVPRMEEGPVFEAGKQYTFEIDAAMPDATGQPLAASYRKPIIATASDVTQPAPNSWKITPPVADTREPLSVLFEESLDQAMLERVLQVVDASGNAVEGEIQIHASETHWMFKPQKPWSAGRYELVVSTALEDNAGNSIGRPFELDRNKVRERPEIPPVHRIAFEVKQPAQLTFQEQSLRNWHQWRGPLANGLSPLGDPPIKWSPTENVVWKTPIPGQGSATPAVWGNRIFVATAVETDRKAEKPPEPDPSARTTPPPVYYRFVLVCLDRDTGKVLWERTAAETVPHEGLHQTNTYAAASPTTDGTRVYVSFGSRGVFCYDFEGNQIWKRDLGRMRTRSGWGEGTSPVVHEDAVVINWDHEDDSALYVLDAKTGENRWRVDRDEPTSWATPLITEYDGTQQLIVNATNRVRSYDLKTGKILWECGGQTVNTIPSPVRFEDLVICMSGYRGNLALAIPLSSQGDLTGKDQEVWRITRNTPYVPSPLLYNRLLYFTRGNTNLLTCLDAGTGRTVIGNERLDALDNVYSSPVAAAGKVYFTDRNGTTMVIKAGPSPETLSVNRLEEPVDASPVIIGERILLRSHHHLYCIGK